MNPRRTAVLALVAVAATAAFVWALQRTFREEPDSTQIARAPSAATPSADSSCASSFPRSFLGDGHGPIDIEPFLEEEREPLPDDLRSRLANLNAEIDRDPANLQQLADSINLLLWNNRDAIAVPYYERWRAHGEGLNVTGYKHYIRGLLMLARFDDAVAVHKEMERGHPGFPETVHAAVTVQLYRCLHACRVKRDLSAAAELHIAMTREYYYNSYRPEYLRSIKAIRQLIRESIGNGNLIDVLPAVDHLWDYLPASAVQEICGELEAAGLTPTEAMRKAASNPMPSTSASASACLLRGDVLWYEEAFETSLQCMREGVKRARETGNDRQLYASLRNLGWYSLEHGDIETFCDATREMEVLANRIGEIGRIGMTVLLLAATHEELGDGRAAMEGFWQAVQFGREHNNTYLETVGMTDFARMAAYVGVESKEAEDHLRSLVENIEPGKEKGVAEAISYANYGYYLERQGRFDEALVQFKQVLDVDYPFHLCEANLGIGRIHLARQEYAEAENAFDEAGRSLEKLKSKKFLWAWQQGKAQARMSQGDLTGARHWIDLALKSIESQRASLKDYHRRQTIHNNKYLAYLVAIELALKQNDHSAAFALSERARSRAFADALGERDEAVSEVKLVGIDEFKALGRQDTTVVYFIAADHLLVWVIGQGDVQFIRKKIDLERLYQRIGAFHLRMSELWKRPPDPPGAGEAPSPDPATRALCCELYDTLWRPLAPHVPPGRRVCIIPHQSLHYVPFQALHDGKKYLVEQQEVYYAPSASALCLMARRKMLPCDEFLVLDAVLAKNRDAPFGRTETLRLRELYPRAQVLLREKATVEAFRRLAPTSRVVHVSSHGHFDPWIPMRSGLQLSAGKPEEHEILEARDVYRMRLPRTQLVVMSACVSSVGDLAGGDEVTGLTRAFQVAGVPNVIGSLWTVSNSSTTRLMNLFYRELRETPTDPVRALCTAQREVLALDANLANWAAFQVSGCGDFELLRK